ncbi:hypothetical protein [Niallia sp. 01092]|uniref:hypothetical protein n=1 Tax=unclassified Niallia TaxID=2837522 RepID=UPI003FCEECED
MSYSTSFIQKLFKQENNLWSQPLPLRPGQIMYGKIMKLFPNQIAEVQVGQQKLYAHLSIPLSVEANYWFQVQQGQEKLELKVLSPLNETVQMDKNNITTLLRQQSLPDTKENRALVASFLTDQLPLTKEILQKASNWLTKSNDTSSEIAVIKQMVQQELPLTNTVFSSLLQVQSGQSFSDLINALNSELNIHSIKNKPLEQVVANIMTGVFTSEDDSKQIKQQIMKMLHSIGFSYESEQFFRLNETNNTEVETKKLKPLLLELLKTDIPVSTNEIANQLVDKITGLQLLSREVGPIIQAVMQLPISFANHTKDVTVQYNGKKTKDGKIDSDYCRIMFYLDLEHLKETAIDMQIQNRVMNITIWNNHPIIQSLAAAYTNTLKEKMKQADYILLNVNSKPFSKKETNIKNGLSFLDIENSYKNFYQGVDVKI